MKKPKIKSRLMWARIGPQQKAAAKFFYLLWCVVVLNPRHPIRGFMKSAGLIEPRGPLKLSVTGHGVLDVARAPGGQIVRRKRK